MRKRQVSASLKWALKISFLSNKKFITGVTVARLSTESSFQWWSSSTLIHKNKKKFWPYPLSAAHGTTWGEYSGCNSRPTNVTIQIYARLFGRNDLYEHIAISAGRKNTCNKGAIGRTGRGTGRYEWEIKSRRPTDNVGMCVCRYTGRMCGAGLVLSIEFKNSD